MSGSSSRRPYYLMGILVDFIDMDDAIDHMEKLCNSDRKVPGYIATLNLHYVFMSLRDSSFRRILLDADLCSPDGIPFIWMANFLGIPNRGRVTGADLLPAILNRELSRTYKVFIFGTTEESAGKACQLINTTGKSLEVVGHLSPEIGTAEELSRDEYIDRINSSGAEILFISLEAKKAMKWITLNREKLNVKVISQIGAAVDFLSGKLPRAPRWMQAHGLEWLYRFIREPHRLAVRYLTDGLMLIYLLIRYLLPYKWLLTRRLHEFMDEKIEFTEKESEGKIRISASGVMSKLNYDKAKGFLESLSGTGKDVDFDLSGLRIVDNLSLGLLWSFRENMKHSGRHVKYTSPSKLVGQIAGLNLFDL